MPIRLTMFGFSLSRRRFSAWVIRNRSDILRHFVVGRFGACWAQAVVVAEEAIASMTIAKIFRISVLHR